MDVPQYVFAVDGRHIWLSANEQDLLVKMRPDGVAAFDENGRLTIEGADGSPRPCGFDVEGLRNRIAALERSGLLVSDRHKRWSLTDQGRRIRARLTRSSVGTFLRSCAADC